MAMINLGLTVLTSSSLESSRAVTVVGVSSQITITAVKTRPRVTLTWKKINKRLIYLKTVSKTLEAAISMRISRLYKRFCQRLKYKMSIQAPFINIKGLSGIGLWFGVRKWGWNLGVHNLRMEPYFPLEATDVYRKGYSLCPNIKSSGH